MCNFSQESESSKYWEKRLGCPDPYPVPVWKQFLDIRIRLQTHYPAGYQRWPESIFQTPTPLLFQKFLILVRIWQFFKFEKPSPVQTPATIIDPTKVYPCVYLRNDHSDSGSGFSQIFDSRSGSDRKEKKEKRRILPESERKTQNPAGEDSSNPDPVPPLTDIQQANHIVIIPDTGSRGVREPECRSRPWPESQQFSKIAVEPEWIFLRKGRSGAGVSFLIGGYFASYWLLLLQIIFYKVYYSTTFKCAIL